MKEVYVGIFTNHCITLVSTYNHMKMLIDEGKDSKSPVHRIGQSFLYDMHNILKEHVMLQVCRLTDKDNKSLTVSSMVQLNKSHTEFQKLERLSKDIAAFVVKIRPARNKIIGHLDKDILYSGIALGAAPLKLWEKFFKDLQDFVNIINNDVVPLDVKSDFDAIPHAFGHAEKYRAVGSY